MKPYYEDDVVRLYHADADAFLATYTLSEKTVDLILTDPPYNVSDRNGRERTTVGTLKRKDGTKREVVRNFGEWDYAFDPKRFLTLSYVFVKVGGSLIAFTSEFLMQPFLASAYDHMSTAR